MKILKIPSTKIQIPGPDRLNPYGTNYLQLQFLYSWWFTLIKSRQGGLKQIAMAQIQNSKQTNRVLQNRIRNRLKIYLDVALFAAG